jgi:hypothetical protein
MVQARVGLIISFLNCKTTQFILQKMNSKIKILLFLVLACAITKAIAQVDTVYIYTDIAKTKHILNGNTLSVALAEEDKKYFKETYKETIISNTQKLRTQQLFALAKVDTASYNIDDTVYCPYITIQTKNSEEHFYISLTSNTHQILNYLFDELLFNEKYNLTSGDNLFPINISLASDNKYTYYDATKNRYELTNYELEFIPVNTKESSSGIYSGSIYDSKSLNDKESKKIIALFKWAITNKKVQTNKNIKPNAVVEIKFGDEIKNFILQAKAPINITINNYLKQLIKSNHYEAHNFISIINKFIYYSKCPKNKSSTCSNRNKNIFGYGSYCKRSTRRSRICK